MKQEEVIKKYFQAWIEKNIDVVKQTFSNDIVYCECFGPEYHGIAQIQKWFTDWNKNGHVLEWRIKRIISHNTICVVEWYFKCNYNNVEDGFDGVTIAEFDDNIKITKLSEFQSKAEHYFPYGN
jgi:hypothetical protein